MAIWHIVFSFLLGWVLVPSVILWIVIEGIGSPPQADWKNVVLPLFLVGAVAMSLLSVYQARSMLKLKKT